MLDYVGAPAAIGRSLARTMNVLLCVFERHLARLVAAMLDVRVHPNPEAVPARQA